MIIDKVEDGKFVQYERSGECLKCGQCCQCHIGYEVGVRPADAVEDDDNRGSLDKWESYAVFKAQRLWWWIKILEVSDGDGCCDLENSLCKTHKDFDDRSPVCRYWPFDPDHILEGCGYSFTPYSQISPQQ